MESVPGVVDAGWEGMFGGEAVAWRDADDVILGDEQAEQGDLVFRVADAVAAAVEHYEDREAAGLLCRRSRSEGFEDDNTRHVAVAHRDVGGCFEDIFGTAGSQRALETREASGGEALEV